MSVFRQKKVLLPVLSAVLAMLVGALIFVVPPPLVKQMHETAAGQYLKIEITPTITAEMDAQSSITVLKTDPPKVELIQGNLYINDKSPQADQINLEVTLVGAVINGMGGSFSVQQQKDQYQVAVASQRIEIKTLGQSRMVNAGRQIAFDNAKIISESAIGTASIAPWRQP